MRTSWIFFTLFISQAGMARTVVPRAPQADAVEYSAYVKSSPQWQFPSEYLLERIPSAAARNHLTELFTQAQLSYTSGSISRAIEDFKRVVEFAVTDHWTEDERQVFLHSYLRLAQMDTSSSEKWLRAAAVLFVAEQVDTSLFPPPLLERFRSVRGSMPEVKIDLSAFCFRISLCAGRRSKNGSPTRKMGDGSARNDPSDLALRCLQDFNRANQQRSNLQLQPAETSVGHRPLLST